MRHLLRRSLALHHRLLLAVAIFLVAEVAAASEDDDYRDDEYYDEQYVRAWMAVWVERIVSFCELDSVRVSVAVRVRVVRVGA